MKKFGLEFCSPTSRGFGLLGHHLFVKDAENLPETVEFRFRGYVTGSVPLIIFVGNTIVVVPYVC